VDDEGVDRDLWIAEDDGERVRSEDGETDRHLPAGAICRGTGTGEDREDDAMTRVVEQSAESGGAGVHAAVPGEDVLRVGVGRCWRTSARTAGRSAGRAVRVTTRDRKAVPDTGALPWTVEEDCTAELP
jgi:hypothetical protein